MPIGFPYTLLWRFWTAEEIVLRNNNNKGSRSNVNKLELVNGESSSNARDACRCLFIICVIVYNLYYCCYAKTSSSAVQKRHSKVYEKPPSLYSISPWYKWYTGMYKLYTEDLQCKFKFTNFTQVSYHSWNEQKRYHCSIKVTAMDLCSKNNEQKGYNLYFL